MRLDLISRISGTEATILQANEMQKKKERLKMRWKTFSKRKKKTIEIRFARTTQGAEIRQNVKVLRSFVPNDITLLSSRVDYRRRNSYI